MNRRLSRTTQRVPIHGSSQIGEARRTAARLAAQFAFTETQAGKVALVATELATNIVRYTKGGDLLLQALDSPNGPIVELLAIDSGPGMGDPRRCLQDGYSSRGTSGTGLGAVRRQSSEFDLASHPEHGSVVLSRIPARHEIDIGADSVSFGAIALPHPREVICGDLWQLDISPVGSKRAGIQVTVVDGLGHGPAAATAAEAADRVLSERQWTSPESYLRAADVALKGTRGAAAASAWIDLEGRELRFAGVGNVAGQLLGGDSQSGLLSHYGIVGGNVRRIQELSLSLPSRFVLVLHSDGLQTRWDLSAYPGLARAHPALIAATLWRDYQRGSDDSSIVVVATPGGAG